MQNLYQHVITFVSRSQHNLEILENQIETLKNENNEENEKPLNYHEQEEETHSYSSALKLKFYKEISEAKKKEKLNSFE